MRRRGALGGFLLAILGMVSGGCGKPLELAPLPPDEELAVGQEREVTLRFLRLDVKNFEKTLGLEELRALPRRTLEETWLLDLDARPLVVNALERFLETPAEEVYALPEPARNMFFLLGMTPENARLDGTSLEALSAVGEAVGISPSRILADLANVAPNERIAPTDVVAEVVVEQVIGTHPNAKTRRGPATETNPEGRYPVTPGAIPVSLYDVATDFSGLAAEFGPTPLDPQDPTGLMHPGFLRSASGLSAAGQGFRMTVRVSVNALPFKGIEASRAKVASVNSMGGQVEHAFDFNDPHWLSLEGLTQNLSIREMAMTIDEDPAYLPGGTSRDPAPLGNSPVWQAPPWVTERVLAEVGRRIAKNIPAHCTVYSPAGLVTPPFEAVRVCIDADAFVTITVDPSVSLSSPPPPPSYFWDLLLEVSQARMHDGGLSEGQANVVMPVRDVSVGVPTEAVVARIRENFEQDPVALRGMAEALTQSTSGDADLFYVQPDDTAEDWLFFIAPEDIRKDASGEPVRAYSYAHRGFYADAELTRKISEKTPLEGDTTHEKIRVEPGDVFFVENAEGRVFEIVASRKPSLHRFTLVVTRVR